jgi:hypothetical protein
MSSEEIESFWLKNGEPTAKFSVSDLKSYGLQDFTMTALNIIGLPADAAPFLSFNQSADEFLSPNTYFQLGNPALNHFVIIGSDGAGNPLVLDTRSHDQVLLLDHENGFEASFVNYSLPEMLACLMFYNQFVVELLASRGDDAYLDADFTDAQFTALRNSLIAINEHIVERSGFWHDELDGLLANREYYRKESKNT